MKLKKIILNLLLIILIIIFSYSVYNIYILYTDNKNNNELIKEVQDSAIIDNSTNTNETIDNNKENNILYLELDFEKLNDINTDTVAWITINNTNINYPIVQTKNNDYYLEHSFDKSKNANGWIFLNYKNNSDFSDQNTIIFGHNTNGTTMFSQLKDIYQGKLGKDFTITIYLKTKEINYKVFSVYLTEEEDNTPLSNYLTNELIEDAKSKSKLNFNIDADENDSILTLSTCYNTTDEKIILQAKKI